MTLVRPHGFDRYTVKALFQYPSGVYDARISTRDGFARFLDFVFAIPEEPHNPALYLLPNIAADTAPCAYLKFDYNLDTNTAAAVTLAIDHDNTHHCWLTQGHAARDDIHLTADSWNPDENLFPLSSYITIAQLRHVILDWAFDNALLSSATTWTPSDPHAWPWI